MAKKNYNESLTRLLAHEGGYSNHPSDPGGPTNFGITIIDARKYWKRDATAADIRTMPVSVAKDIYRSKYWDAMRCDELPSGVDYAIFDYGVNSGVSRAIKVLERILELSDDGKPDDNLIQLANARDAKTLVAAICDERLEFLQGLKTWPVFGKGWGTRVREVRALALKMAADASPPVPAPPKKPQTAPVDAPVTKPREAPKTNPTADEPKAAVKSKTIWAAIMAALTTAGSTFVEALGDWRVWTAIIVLCLLAYIIWERNGKPDIRGIFRSGTM